jgi:ABC-type transport system involved in cytochrome c biogenesis permease subunit
MTRMVRTLAAAVALAAWTGWAAGQTAAETPEHDHAHDHDHGHNHAPAPAPAIAVQPPKWDPEIVRLFATLPVQDEGRVKPLSTYANFALMRMNGKREYRDLDGKRGTPAEWLLDVLFYPESAKHYKMFVISNSEVADAIGIAHDDKNRRDRYSFLEIEPGMSTLFKRAGEYSQKEAKDRSLVEQQVLNLAHAVNEFQMLVHYLDFARYDFPVEESPALTQILPPATSGEFTAILGKVATLRGLYATLNNSPEGIDAQTVAAEKHALEHVLRDLGRYGDVAEALSLFPPQESRDAAPEWKSPADVTLAVFSTDRVPEHEMKMLGALEKLALLKDRPAEFKAQLETLHAMTAGAAEARGEYAKVPLEYFFYYGSFERFKWIFYGLFAVGAVLLALLIARPDKRWAIPAATVAFAIPLSFMGYYFYYALTLYVASFILVGLLWLRPGSRALSAVIPVCIAVPTILVMVGITLRCIIRSRPPVSTLYETILFITAVIVVVSLFIEYINRQKLALSMASILGVMGMFLANKYELKEGVDTMPTLVAVLDTNFWLATHVVTVTMGYAAGLLAGAIAHVYILGKLFNLKRNDKPFYKSVTRMTYGVLCFGLFFATLGTVLGGIWANDSWGRFWGWDPKENGALMIVLWMLAVLHARMGGYIRDLGIAMSSVFGGMVVAFSWWGVNLLGVGLHSYGFTSGIMKSLVIFYGIETVVLLMGASVYLRERAAEPQIAPEPVPAKPRRKPTRA